jgi:hypothetical protein
MDFSSNAPIHKIEPSSNPQMIEVSVSAAATNIDSLMERRKKHATFFPQEDRSGTQKSVPWQSVLAQVA